jgi:hypothetical protein
MIMAIMAVFTGKVTAAEYDAVRKATDWEGNPPQGGVLHVAGFDEQGDLHITDIWESMDDFQAFAQNHLGPVMEKLKVTMPDAAFYPIRNVNAYPAITAHLV